MKKKTKLKLNKRWLSKPLHHIDTCIIIESGKEETKLRRICKKYIHKVGYNYRGCFSLPMLGEYLLKILTEIRDEYNKRTALSLISEIAEKKKISFYVSKDIGSLTKEIIDLDARIEQTDALLIACAIENNADAFVTLDKKLIHNKPIENKFKIKICHPEELT